MKSEFYNIARRKLHSTLSYAFAMSRLSALKEFFLARFICNECKHSYATKMLSEVKRPRTKADCSSEMISKSTTFNLLASVFEMIL